MSLSQTKKPSQEKTETKKEGLLKESSSTDRGFAPCLGVIAEQRLYLNSLSTYQWAKSRDTL